MCCGSLGTAHHVSERLPMEEGMVAPDTSMATAYAWLVINKQPSPLRYIPLCYTAQEKSRDYDALETIQAVRAIRANRIL